MTDHSNLKAKAEADHLVDDKISLEEFETALQKIDKEMVIDVVLQYALNYRKLQSELTTLKAQVDSAFNEGVEAAAKCANDLGIKEQENFGLVRSAQNYYRARDDIRKLTRPTKPTEAKDGSK